MAVIRSKGTLLQMSVATVMTTISQLISLELPEAENETFEADFLERDGAGIPYKSTGRTEGGEVGFEGFLDPTLASHQFLTSLLETPAADGTAAQIVFADEDETEWPFTAAGVSLGGTAALKDGLKMKGKLKLDGIVTYPEAA